MTIARQEYFAKNRVLLPQELKLWSLHYNPISGQSKRIVK
jgi:hypothetical protein